LAFEDTGHAIDFKWKLLDTQDALVEIPFEKRPALLRGNASTEISEEVVV